MGGYKIRNDFYFNSQSLRVSLEAPFYWKSQTLVTWTVTQLTGKALDQIHVWKVFSVNMDYVCTTNAMY